MMDKNFIKSIGEDDLSLMLSKQINNLIPDNNLIANDSIFPYIKPTFNRIFQCFKWINNKYYSKEGDVYFNHLHSDHYCSFLYLLSNTIYLNRADDLASKVFLLNKYLHGIDLYFSIKLPEVFMLVHPVGSVIGNAEYSNFFVAYQNCTIGSIYKGGKYIYPKFEENVILYAKSSVIGNCHINSNVTIGANTFVLNSKVPSGSIVTGVYPDLDIRMKKEVKSPFFYM